MLTFFPELENHKIDIDINIFFFLKIKDEI